MPATTDQTKVFNTLLGELIDHIHHADEHAIADLKDDLAGMLNSSRNLRKITVKTLLAWGKTLQGSRQGRIETELDRKEMMEFIHLLYVWSCEILGPVETDSLFAAAIRQTERLPEARKFPPKQLF